MVAKKKLKAKKRDYKKDYIAQKARMEKDPKVHAARMTRQQNRRDFDKAHTGTMTKVASARKGKDLSDNVPLSKDPSGKAGHKLESPSKNRARNLQKKGKGKTKKG